MWLIKLTKEPLGRDEREEAKWLTSLVYSKTRNIAVIPLEWVIIFMHFLGKNQRETSFSGIQREKQISKRSTTFGLLHYGLEWSS